MTKFLEKLKKLCNLLLAHFPSKLPTTGKTEYTAWEANVLALYDLPNLPSYRHALATAIMHLPTTCSHAPISFFGKTIRKAMANQIAYDTIYSINEEEKLKKSLEVAKESEQMVVD